jgi:hypothetical protein
MATPHRTGSLSFPHIFAGLKPSHTVLGRIIVKRGVHITLDLTRKIQKWTAPTCIDEYDSMLFSEYFYLLEFYLQIKSGKIKILNIEVAFNQTREINLILVHHNNWSRERLLIVELKPIKTQLHTVVMLRAPEFLGSLFVVPMRPEQIYK